MRSKFDEQLKKLNEEMMHMGSMIEESIQKAIEAFIHQDADSAKAIMEGDSEIDREQKKIESLCFNLLMQQQPVARDLRTISAAMKMVTDMERIGDHAADISEMTILMSSDKPYRVNIEHVKSMASETMLMLIRAIEAYVEKNNDKAYIVMKQDDVVDELFDKVKAELIDFIRSIRRMVSRQRIFSWLQNTLSVSETMRQILQNGLNLHLMTRFVSHDLIITHK